MEAPFRSIASRAKALPSTSTSDRKSTRLNSSHSQISYAVFCLKKKNAQALLVDAVDHCSFLADFLSERTAVISRRVTLFPALAQHRLLALLFGDVIVLPGPAVG